MGEVMRCRRSCRVNLLAAVAMACISLWSGTGYAGTSGVPKAAQEAFEKKDYAQVLEQLAKLEKDQASAPDVRRLKIRSLLKLGNPKDALGEYDKLELALKQDDLPLLREVAMGLSSSW